MMTGIIDTGCANIASVRFALDRLGQTSRVLADADQASECERLILPGVGAAGPAMAQLLQRGWTERLSAETRPLLGICLGMQLLFDRSEEGGTAGLGLISGEVSRLPRPPGGVWPHMGWNSLDVIESADPLLAGVETGEHVYFVHGYYVPTSGYTRASTEYGEAISAIVRHGPVSGCQFHPERSGAVGARILANFLDLKS